MKVKNDCALVIDDEQDICMLLRSFLLRSFKRVETAHTLEGGYALAEKMHPDVIFLDNNLPDGMGILRIPDFKKTCKKIIIISAMSNLDAQAYSSGASAFITKPISFRDIQEVIA